MARSKASPVRNAGVPQERGLHVEELRLSPLRRGLVTQAWLRLALTSPGGSTPQELRQVSSDEDARL